MFFCFYFVRFNRDFLDSSLDVVKNKEFGLWRLIGSFKDGAKMAYFMSPSSPISPPKHWLYLSCTVFIESHNADVENV